MQIVCNVTQHHALMNAKWQLQEMAVIVQTLQYAVVFIITTNLYRNTVEKLMLKTCYTKSA